ncbi:MAG: bifunctional [glutamate--ammonia ligase]-adenylyl-L-tyrosine phosphorylase/[glutamate--ammonia-ligase] adenylyltransferase [Sandaracinus sp.]
MPSVLSERARDGDPAALTAFAERGGSLARDDVRDVVLVLSAHAPGLLPLLSLRPGLAAEVLDAGLEQRTRAELVTAEIATEVEAGVEIARALRHVRHHHVLRIALRELLRLADVDHTSAEMAELASGCIESALTSARAAVEERHGLATTADGRPMPLVCLGMGKLGGGELNLGSDVDLCFFYETDDGEVAGGDLVVHEHCSRIVARATKLLSDVTEDGLCFRVDLRLRPEGSRGPLTNSLASAERYYETFGRTWERAALLRARPVAGDRALGEELLAALGPFVYRRRVDPGLAREMHDMVERARRELKADERDVKLGRGGIREAEFFVQTLCLIWGGLDARLRVPGTMEALARLEGAGLVSARESRTLAESWALLRRVEHRVHAWTGYQTHRVPPDGEEKERFARSLGYEDAAGLDRSLGRARTRVAELFDSLLVDRSAERPREADLCDRIAEGATEQEIATSLEGILDVADAGEGAVEVAHHLKRLARYPDAPLGPLTRERHPALGPSLIAEIAAAADPLEALRSSADFFARLRGFDLGIFEREPRLLRRMVGLFGASPVLSRALVGHPDEIALLVLAEPIDERAIAIEHEALGAQLGELEDEAFVHALRRIKREVTLRVGIALVSSEVALPRATELLSLLAEGQVALAARKAIAECEARHGAPQAEASLGVIALGKLGSRELGFGGDLDLVFVYDEEGETAGPHVVTHSEHFTRAAQRTMRLLAQPDGEGPGWATDTRLRPSGSQGTLVVPLASFERHHEEAADAWERQALTRARVVSASPRLAERIDAAIVRSIASARPIDHARVTELRGRSQRELGSEAPHRYHVKLGHGAMLDVELLAQLARLEAHLPGGAMGTLATLTALHKAGHLERETAETLERAWIFFRTVEQTLRLLSDQGEPLLRTRSRSGEHVARRLGLRARDGRAEIEVLEATYRRHAERVRAIFEARVGPVGVASPFPSE